VSLSDLHTGWAWFVVVANGLAGLWALAAHRWEQVRHRALWWFTAVAQLSILVEVVIGVILLNQDGAEVPQFHTFYGFVAVFAAAIIYSYRQQLKGWLYLLYGFGGLFLMGLALRAMTIGPTR
jgi:lipoprotein signal peptidase